MEFKVKFGHEANCTPGMMIIEAASLVQAVVKIRDFVTTGFRNATWATIETANGHYSARNVDGRAVGEFTRH